MILFTGEKKIKEFIKSISEDISSDIALKDSKGLIITEYNTESVNLVQEAKKLGIPVLGIIDGYRSVVEAFGGECYDLAENVDGKQEWVVIDATSPLYLMLESVIQASRAKPFAVVEKTCPKDLDVMSRSENGEMLAVRNKIDDKNYGDIYAINYHLDSELTPDGIQITKNFIDICNQ